MPESPDVDQIARRGNWLPINTAPKDATRFFAWTIERSPYAPAPTRRVEIARWAGHYFASDSGAIPTHWMPLPDPPASAPPQEPAR